MKLAMRILTLSLLCSMVLFAADPYSGPRPPKPDLPYLVHADKLVATETSEATQESKKDEVTYAVAGTASEAKTPVPEPIFLLQSEKVFPDRLELYRFDVRNGRRELTMSTKGGRSNRNQKPLFLSVTKVEGNLYRIEASQPLEEGQYSLSPNDSNKVFCFEVY